MKALYFAMLFALMGCASETQYSADTKAKWAAMSAFQTRQQELASDFPIKPPTGKVSTLQVAQVFAKGCLMTFPNVKQTLTELKRAGLTSSYELGWDAGENGLESKSLGISAAMGNMRFGETVFGTVCEVVAEVSDPTNSPAAALHSIRPDLEFTAGGTASTSRDGGAVAVSAQKSGLLTVVPWMEQALKKDGWDWVMTTDLDDPRVWAGAYREWGKVTFSIGFPEGAVSITPLIPAGRRQ